MPNPVNLRIFTKPTWFSTIGHNIDIINPRVTVNKGVIRIINKMTVDDQQKKKSLHA